MPANERQRRMDPSRGWRPGRCQWIPTEPSYTDACKCGEPVDPAAPWPYCAEHAEMAKYTPGEDQDHG